MVSFVDAIKLFYKRYVDFQGRSSRSEYWCTILYQFLVLIAFAIAIGFAPGGLEFLEDIENNTGALSGFGNILFWLAIIFLLINLLPNIALAVRRFHDLGQTGWLVLVFNLLGNIPLIGIFIACGHWIWYVFPGNKGDNKYGPDPRGGGIENVFD